MGFNTYDLHFELLVFTLSRASTVVQESVNEIFSDLVCVVVYLDNILVFSTDLDTHRRQISTIMQCLWEIHLYTKLENCLFEKTPLPFQGYMIFSKVFTPTEQNYSRCILYVI